MASTATNLEDVCTWMDENLGEEEGRTKRQKDQFWRGRLNTEFLKAVRRSDLEQVNKWHRFGASVHAKCRRSGDTAVHIAASLEDDAVLRKLLELGASPTAKNLKGQEPIHVAVWLGKVEAVKALCERDATVVDSIILKNIEEENSINDRDACDTGEEPKDLISKEFEDGSCPLHIASTKNLLCILELLIDEGAKVQTEDSNKTNLTPLDVVGIHAEEPHNTEKAFISVYSFFLNNQLRMPKVVNWFGGGRCEKVQRSNTALHTAVQLEYLTAIENLLDEGACLGVWDEWGETAIHITIRDELMKSLLAILKWNRKNHALKVDVRNHRGLTSLQLASYLGYADFVAVLLQGGADPSLTTRIKKESFVGGHWSFNWDFFVYSNDECERRTSLTDVEKGTDTTESKQDLLTLTACCCAVMGNSLECVKILSLDGGPLKFVLENKMNLLHLAAWCNAPEIIKFLLDKYKELNVLNARVDQICEEGTGLNEFGMAPIHFASFHSAKTAETIKLLVEEGECNINLSAQSEIFGNNTPLHFATIKGIWKDIELIYKYDKEALKRKYGKRKQDRQVLMVPHAAAVYSHPDTLRQLLFLGADLSSVSKDETRKLTLVETIEMYLDNYVGYLEEILDEYIDLEHYDDDKSHVVLKYQILAPGDKSKPQMEVLNALVTDEKVEERQALLLHPLTVTFLYLKWQKLKTVFNVCVCFQLIMTLLITALGYMRYVHIVHPQPSMEVKEAELAEHSNVSVAITTIFRCLLGFVATIMILLNPSIYLEKLHKFVWMLNIQTLTWLMMIVSSFLMVFANGSYQWERGVAALAILLSWIELHYLLARYPWSSRYPLGYHYVMFLTVAANFIQVVASFLLLFVAFTMSFLVLLSNDEDDPEDPNPYKSTIRSFLKTLTMMHDFDDQQFFKNSSNSHSLIGDIGLFLRNGIFLGFFFLMCIAMVNFMTGVAIDGISALKRQGKARQIFEQAQTLSRLEKIMNKALLKKAKIGIQVPPTQTVWLKDCLRKNKDIPRDMALCVYERVKIILNNKKMKKEKEEEKEKKEKSRNEKKKTYEEITNIVKEIQEKICNLK